MFLYFFGVMVSPWFCLFCFLVAGASVVSRAFSGLNHGDGATAAMPDAMRFLDASLALEVSVMLTDSKAPRY